MGTDGPEHQEWSRRVIDRKPKEAGSKSPKTKREGEGRGQAPRVAALHYYRDSCPAIAQRLNRTLTEIDLLVT
jgi:hypothetical protein